jgi:hypothetical protein
MNERVQNKNDLAWNNIFEKYSILDEIEKKNFFEITSKQINEFREARLMTKFDHRVNLPLLFKEYGLSILPISRGRYIISSFQAYHEFEKIDNKIYRISPPSYIETIDFDDISSEAIAINVAYLSGILSDFVGEELLFPTVNGRMSSKNFDFKIWDTNTSILQPVKVENSQIEIDGGFEGNNSLSLIEAKNSISSDFLIRQLYYPFRLWKDKLVNTQKKVKNIFLIYSNGVFHLFEYVFQNTNVYNSLVLVKQKNYSMENQKISLVEIIRMFQDIQVQEEPIGIPFPQADSFERVINLCELLYRNKSLTKEEITTNYDFDTRQTTYYTDACRYLGLVKKNNVNPFGVSYCLTSKGLSLFNQSLKDRNLGYIKCILERKAFYDSFKKYISSYKQIPKNEIVDIMENSNLYNIKSKTTFRRRASTIKSWINWIIEITQK